MEDDIFITTCNYRDFSFSVYKNDSYYYTIIFGKTIKFKSDNWEAEIKETVDKHLDLIFSFDDDTWLAWFNNGDFRDIKLVKGNRILRVFLVQSEINAISFDAILWKKIIPESEKLLKKLNKIK